MLEEARTLGGERYARRLAVEQADAQIILELLDRRGDRGLRDIELDRRLAHLAGIGGGDEITHLFD